MSERCTYSTYKLVKQEGAPDAYPYQFVVVTNYNVLCAYPETDFFETEDEAKEYIKKELE